MTTREWWLIYDARHGTKDSDDGAKYAELEELRRIRDEGFEFEREQ